MTHVITLVGDPRRAPVSPGVAEAARSALSRLGGRVGDTDWLSPGTACDVPIEGIDPGAAVEAVRAALPTRPVDVVAQRPDHRRKRLLLADMDSTIIRQECVDEIAGFVGRRAEVAAITERAMRGDVDFAEAVRERAAMFAGLDAEVLDRVCDERVSLTPGAETLVRVMRRDGALTVLASGGFTRFTSRVAERAGFDLHHGNELEVAAGKLTGKAVEPIEGGAAKARLLDRYRDRLGVPAELTLAVGDGANDVPMIEAAGLGVAFRGKPGVVEAADAAIDHGDLTALLYIQGFREAEIDA